MQKADLMRKQAFILATLVLAGAARAADKGGTLVPSGLGEQVMKIAGVALNVVLAVTGVGAAGLIVWIGYAYYSKRQIGTPAPFMDEERGPEAASRFEQVLAELQGIRLGIESGNDTAGNFEKFGRLVRIFAAKAGVTGARDMPLAKLREALPAAHFSAKQTQMLVAILERSEKAMRIRRDQIDFDPKELVKDFKYVIDQVEGREPETD